MRSSRSWRRCRSHGHCCVSCASFLVACAMPSTDSWQRGAVGGSGVAPGAQFRKADRFASTPTGKGGCGMAAARLRRLPHAGCGSARARIVCADLLVPPTPCVRGHRPELSALGLHLESLSGRDHHVFAGRGISASSVGYSQVAAAARTRLDQRAISGVSTIVGAIQITQLGLKRTFTTRNAVMTAIIAPIMRVI